MINNGSRGYLSCKDGVVTPESVVNGEVKVNTPRRGTVVLWPRRQCLKRYLPNACQIVGREGSSPWREISL